MEEESSKYYTFWTTKGLYKFNTLAQGVSSASAETHDRIRRILQGVEGVIQIKDDMIVHGKGAEHYRTPLNTQTYKWRDGWMGWLSLGCATYRASLGANKLSVYNSESLCKMFVRKEEILAGKIPVF